MIKTIDDIEYDILVSWWAARSFPMIPKKCLPSTTYVVYNDNKPIIATALYLPKDEHCYMAMTAWYTANPATTVEERLDSLLELEEHISKVCKENSINTIISFTSKDRLAKNLELTGYMPLEEGVYLMKSLGV